MRTALLSLGSALAPHAARACAVCFGKNEALAAGLNWGIGILIGFTALSMTGIIFAVLRIEKARAAAEAKAALESETAAALSEAKEKEAALTLS